MLTWVCGQRRGQAVLMRVCALTRVGAMLARVCGLTRGVESENNILRQGACSQAPEVAREIKSNCVFSSGFCSRMRCWEHQHAYKL